MSTSSSFWGQKCVDLASANLEKITERAVFQRSAFRRTTAGNDVIATIFPRLFFFSPLRFFFLRPDLFSKKECSDQETYLGKVA